MHRFPNFPKTKRDLKILKKQNMKIHKNKHNPRKQFNQTINYISVPKLFFKEGQLTKKKKRLTKSEQQGTSKTGMVC